MNEKKDLVGSQNFYEAIRLLILTAQKKVSVVVNVTMVQTYWEIGRLIVEQEQDGKERAKYGSMMISKLAQKLKDEFGSVYSERNLSNMRKFYLVFKNMNALRSELSWTHYRMLLRVDNEQSRDFYINEAISNGWSTRVLNRQINSLYYERLLSSNDRRAVMEEMREKTKDLQPEDILKDPYVLEFLQIKDNNKYLEADLETALIDKLSEFLLELGKGFAFVARQKRISADGKHFYVDLVFYNFLLKCFVLVDLKIRELSHEDIGQMDMYVRLYEDKYKGKDDNPTIGLILCTHKNNTIVKYSVLNDNKQLFASKYMLYLPTEDELRKELERERLMIENK
jgi:predicted nuclease of restriction endonuclease-like (RecB) superfamily